MKNVCVNPKESKCLLDLNKHWSVERISCYIGEMEGKCMWTFDPLVFYRITKIFSSTCQKLLFFLPNHMLTLYILYEPIIRITKVSKNN